MTLVNFVVCVEIFAIFAVLIFEPSEEGESRKVK